MPTHDAFSTAARTARRSSTRAGLLAGAVIGLAFVLLTGPAVADQPAGRSSALLDATHLPPLLTLPREAVELRYDVTCAPPDELADDSHCDLEGAVHLRPGETGPFRPLPLRLDPDATEERYVTMIPSDVLAAGRGFTYYAIVREKATGATVTIPPGGANAPHRSLPLERAVEISLGRHAFGQVRSADARVLEAGWGDGQAEVGLEGGRNIPPVGGSSFDVDDTGSVHLLDQVHKRLLTWRAGDPRPAAVPLAIDGTLADVAVGDDGRIFVLETAAGRSKPLLRAFGGDGRAMAVTELAERTASQVRLGPAGPVVHQQPSGQWMPAADARGGLSSIPQKTAARTGRALRGGGEIVLLRRDNEIRVSVVDSRGIPRSWRIVSETAVAEVQLAEPLGNRLLVVARVYSDERDEFVALLLGPKGLVRRWSVRSADWAETAPLSRFRLVGSSLYQLGSTPSGVFVDRFEVETG